MSGEAATRVYLAGSGGRFSGVTAGYRAVIGVTHHLSRIDPTSRIGLFWSPFRDE